MRTRTAPHHILRRETVRAMVITRKPGRRCQVVHYGPWATVQTDDPDLRATVAARDLAVAA